MPSIEEIEAQGSEQSAGLDIPQRVAGFKAQGWDVEGNAMHRDLSGLLILNSINNTLVSIRDLLGYQTELLAKIAGLPGANPGANPGDNAPNVPKRKRGGLLSVLSGGADQRDERTGEEDETETTQEKDAEEKRRAADGPERNADADAAKGSDKADLAGEGVGHSNPDGGSGGEVIGSETGTGASKSGK